MTLPLPNPPRYRTRPLTIHTCIIGLHAIACMTCAATSIEAYHSVDPFIGIFLWILSLYFFAMILYRIHHTPH